jgi:hypothetical protein
MSLKYNISGRYKGHVQLLKPVILAIGEAEIGRIMVQG